MRVFAYFLVFFVYTEYYLVVVFKRSPSFHRLQYAWVVSCRMRNRLSLVTSLPMSSLRLLTVYKRLCNRARTAADETACRVHRRDCPARIIPHIWRYFSRIGLLRVTTATHR